MLNESRHVIRQFARSPGFTLTGIFTLAIGMGVNAVGFSVVNGLVFKPVMARGLAGIGRIATPGGGATPRDLTVDVLRSSAQLLAPGLALGLLTAALLARLAQVAFVGINVLNPASYVLVALLQSVIVALACLGPALQASRVDPLIALRSE